MAERYYNTTVGVLRRLGLFAAVGFLLFLARPTPGLFLAGLTLVVAGEAVRMWAAGHLLKTAELVTSGPYRYTRNPLYLGRLLILSGLCVMAHLPHGGSWVALALGWALFFGYYLPRKERVESARLAAVHGAAFELYRRSVPALLPALHAYPKGAENRWSLDRMVRNREYWMVIGLLLVSLFLLWRTDFGGGHL